MQAPFPINFKVREGQLRDRSVRIDRDRCWEFFPEDPRPPDRCASHSTLEGAQEALVLFQTLHLHLVRHNRFAHAPLLLSLCCLWVTVARL